jgi:hypothetical protein
MCATPVTAARRQLSPLDFWVRDGSALNVASHPADFNQKVITLSLSVSRCTLTRYSKKNSPVCTKCSGVDSKQEQERKTDRSRRLLHFKILKFNAQERGRQRRVDEAMQLELIVNGDDVWLVCVKCDLGGWSRWWEVGCEEGAESGQ